MPDDKGRKIVLIYDDDSLEDKTKLKERLEADGDVKAYYMHKLSLLVSTVSKRDIDAVLINIKSNSQVGTMKLLDRTAAVNLMVYSHQDYDIRSLRDQGADGVIDPFNEDIRRHVLNIMQTHPREKKKEIKSAAKPDYGAPDKPVVLIFDDEHLEGLVNGLSRSGFYAITPQQYAKAVKRYQNPTVDLVLWGIQTFVPKNVSGIAPTIYMAGPKEQSGGDYAANCAEFDGWIRKQPLKQFAAELHELVEHHAVRYVTRHEGRVKPVIANFAAARKQEKTQAYKTE